MLYVVIFQVTFGIMLITFAVGIPSLIIREPNHHRLWSQIFPVAALAQSGLIPIDHFRLNFDHNHSTLRTQLKNDCCSARRNRCKYGLSSDFGK